MSPLISSGLHPLHALNGPSSASPNSCRWMDAHALRMHLARTAGLTPWGVSCRALRLVSVLAGGGSTDRGRGFLLLSFSGLIRGNNPAHEQVELSHSSFRRGHRPGHNGFGPFCGPRTMRDSGLDYLGVPGASFCPLSLPRQITAPCKTRRRGHSKHSAHRPS